MNPNREPDYLFKSSVLTRRPRPRLNNNVLTMTLGTKKMFLQCLTRHHAPRPSEEPRLSEERPVGGTNDYLTLLQNRKHTAKAKATPAKSPPRPPAPRTIGTVSRSCQLLVLRGAAQRALLKRAE